MLDALDQESKGDPELRALVRALKLAGGFKLIFARVDSAADRNRLMRDAEAELGREKIQRVGLESPVSSLLDNLRKVRNPARPISFVYGLESWLPTDAARHPFIAGLNSGRNDLPHAAQGVVVLWCPSHLITSIQRGAPDLFSVRSALYEFKSASSSDLVGLLRITSVLKGFLIPATPPSSSWLKEAYLALGAGTSSRERLAVAAGGLWLRDWRLVVSACSNDISDAEGVDYDRVCLLLILSEALIRLGQVSKVDDELRLAQESLRSSLIVSVGANSWAGAALVNQAPAYADLLLQLGRVERALDVGHVGKGRRLMLGAQTLLNGLFGRGGDDMGLAVSHAMLLHFGLTLRTGDWQEIYEYGRVAPVLIDKVVERDAGPLPRMYRRITDAERQDPRARLCRLYSYAEAVPLPGDAARPESEWVGAVSSAIDLAFGDDPGALGPALTQLSLMMIRSGMITDGIARAERAVEILSGSDLVDRAPVRDAYRALAKVREAGGDLHGADEARQLAESEEDRGSVLDVVVA